MGWRKLFLFVICGSCLGGAASAQDSHYWTNQYGTRANLLGGAVVGSVLDLSGTFYNPGGLSLIEEPETLLAAKVFEYYRISLEDFAGSSDRFYSPKFGPSPALIAGALRFHGLGRSWIGYSVLTRQSVLLRLRGASTGIGDFVPTVPGPEQTAADFRLYEQLTETWFGLTWAYKIKDSLGFGITQCLTYRTHRADVQATNQALTGAGDLILATGSRRYQYNNIRILWKLGLAFDVRGITMGLTVTTPSLKLLGRGTSSLNASTVGGELLGDGEMGDYMAFDVQEGIPADFRTPLSVAFGTTLKLAVVQLYGTAEWFAPIGVYTVMKGADFIAQSSGETHANEVTHEAHSVLNFGVGAECGASEKLKFYASFTTDYSARAPGTATNLSLTDWDIHHVMGGATFTIKRSAVTIGIGYAFGRKRTNDRTEYFSHTGADLLGLDHFSIGKFRYSNLKLVAGFSF
jgi:hypothetical protein